MSREDFFAGKAFTVVTGHHDVVGRRFSYERPGGSADVGFLHTATGAYCQAFTYRVTDYFTTWRAGVTLRIKFSDCKLIEP